MEWLNKLTRMSPGCFLNDDVVKWKHFPSYWPFVKGIYRSQRPLKRNLIFSLICAWNKRLSKQSRGWWFETPSRSLWRHCNVVSGSVLSGYFSSRKSQGSPSISYCFAVNVGSWPSVSRKKYWLNRIITKERVILFISHVHKAFLEGIALLDQGLPCLLIQRKYKHDTFVFSIISQKRIHYSVVMMSVMACPIPLLKGQWRGALVLYLIYVSTKGWANKQDAHDLRRHRANYDVTVGKRSRSITNALVQDVISKHVLHTNSDGFLSVSPTVYSIMLIRNR